MNSYDLSELNILVLEKNVLLRRLLTDVFSEFGVPTVFSTHDPLEAYNYFCNSAPDIIFCDCTPDLDGMSFVRQFRQADDTPNPYSPIVVVTANTELRHVCYARDNGMTEFLAKPISAKTIYARLCSVIENPRAFIRVGEFFGPDRRRSQAEGYESSERRRS